MEPAKPTVYWGAWIDGDTYERPGDAPWDSGTWNLFESHVSKPVSIDHFGQPAPWSQAFSSEPLELTRNRGAIPLMDMSSSGATLKEISNGSRDASLTAWAKAAKSYARPFFLRWDWEMNGTWFKWGQEAAESPSTFVAAWKRFHNIVDENGATNVTWVWCPNTTFTGSTSLTSLYPGSSYVNWTCMDGYNFGTNPLQPAGWKAFYEVFEPTYSQLISLDPSKPIMIGETASTELGGSKPSWIADGFGKDMSVNFPKIKAVNWFNWNISEEGQPRWDWPVESSSASQASFANAISSPYYASNTFKELPPLTPIKPLP